MVTILQTAMRWPPREFQPEATACAGSLPIIGSFDDAQTGSMLRA